MSRPTVVRSAVPRRVPVPARAGELADLGRVDYADAFAVETSVTRTPQEWIREIERTAPALMHLVRLAHRGLGLHLAPADSAEHVLGWTIRRSTAREGLLSVEGRILTPRIVALTTPGQVIVATLLRFEHVSGRPMWAVVAPIHRAVARYLLSRVTRGG